MFPNAMKFYTKTNTFACTVVTTLVLSCCFFHEVSANYPGGKIGHPMARGIFKENRRGFLRDTNSEAPDFGDGLDDNCTAKQPVRMGTIVFDASTEFQTMEGVGGSIVFYSSFVTFHPYKAEIYDAIFGELKPSILRLRNSWDSPNQFQTVEQILDVDEELVLEANNRLPGRKLHIMLTSWSPPAKLKKNGLLIGTQPDAALKKGETTDQFVYDEFVKFWVNGLAAYKERKISPRWIAINEPDYTATFDSARMDASESYTYPGLFKMLDKLYDALQKNMTTPPGIVGPETAVWDNNYIDHPYVGNPRVEAVSGHLYSAGDDFSGPEFFDRLSSLLRNVKQKTEERQVRKVYMTEYAALRDHMYGDPLLLARTIYATLSDLKANMYLNWDLMWGAGTGEGTLLLVDNPFNNDRSSWSNPKGFTRTSSFHWFRHFSNFILPGMKSVGCETSETFNHSVKALCFIDGKGTSTVIMINFGSKMALADVQGIPGVNDVTKTNLYYSTLSSPFTKETSTLPLPGSVFLRPRSITTIHTTG